MRFSFDVIAKPATQGSKNQFGAESCARLALWRADVREAATRALPSGWSIDQPVTVICVFRFARPRSHFGTRKGVPYLKPSAPEHCTANFDVDKLERAILDAITGPVLVNDNRVVNLHGHKVWAEDGVEGATIRVSSLLTCGRMPP
jgi:crossover junction endodeoxyribonuclease RusA